MSYTTKAKVEGLTNTTISNDLTDIIAWVTAYINNFTNTSFEATNPETRYYDGDGTDKLLTESLVSISELDFLDFNTGSVDYTLSTDDYWLYPLNLNPKFEIRLNPFGEHPTFPIGSHRIKVIGIFGDSATVPADIEWVASSMVSDILSDSSITAKQIRSESLGEYSVTYDTSVDKVAYKNILSLYRVPVI